MTVLLAVGLAALALMAVCAVGFGETRLAEQEKLPRNYDTKWFPLYRNGYLFGLIVGALCAGAAMGRLL